MHHRNELARRQLVAYAECLGELIDGGYFPELANELIAVWLDFNMVYQRYLRETVAINAFALEHQLLGDERFHRITLPTGGIAPLYLGEGSSEGQVRRNPSILLGLPRKRRAIDRLRKGA